MFIKTLMQVPACETNITCIIQVTFKFANETWFVHNRWLSLTQFKVFFDPADDKIKLDNGSNLWFKSLSWPCKTSAGCLLLNGRTTGMRSDPTVSIGEGTD